MATAARGGSSGEVVAVEGVAADAVAVSVIVATRNRVHLLADALAGLRAQQGAAFEAVIVDDGSTPEQAAAIARLVASQGPRFRLVTTGPAGHGGSGPAPARNAGLQAARGRWVAFCDDDDRWCDPRHLAIAIQALEAENADVYVANQRGVAGDRVVIADWLPELTAAHRTWPAVVGHGHGRGDDEHGDPTVRRAPVDALVRSEAFAHLNVLIVRRTLALAIGGFWPHVRYEEDRDFWWRVLDATDRVLFRPAVVAEHRVPDPALRANLSTSLSPADRALQRLLVAQHAAATARSPPLARRAARDCGEHLRTLAVLAAADGRPASAAALARQALAARFTFRWFAYAAWLAARSAFSPRRRT